jgi:hypothetical protein
MEPWNTVWNVVCRDLLDRIEWLQKEQKRKGHEERERESGREEKRAIGQQMDHDASLVFLLTPHA